MYDFATWLGKTAFSIKLGEAIWIIPILQSIHILAVGMVLSAVVMIDLRLFGLTSAYSMRQIMTRFMPFLWTGLVILACTGAVQITAEPKRTLNANPAFYLKMAMLVIAVGVMIGFQAYVRRHAVDLDDSTKRKTLLQLAAIVTLALWVGIAFAGRWIAYVQVT
jgi:hypothetical protein